VIVLYPIITGRPHRLYVGRILPSQGREMRPNRIGAIMKKWYKRKTIDGKHINIHKILIEKQLALDYKVSCSAIYYIKYKQTWKHI